jgi:Caulimovirus viroplasmin
MSCSRGRDLVYTQLGENVFYRLPSPIKASIRNFAATQTKGVSSAIYKKYSSKAEAEEAFRLASDDGFVQAL